MLVVPFNAAAKGEKPAKATEIAPGLLKKAKDNPGGKVDVIIQAEAGTSFADQVGKGLGAKLAKKLDLVGGVAVSVPAGKLTQLQSIPGLIVTVDDQVKTSGAIYSSDQIWPYDSGSAKLWPTAKDPGPKLPAIAIVDTGIDATRVADFGGRVIASVNFSSTTPNAVGDGRGHGTFVAGIAAGAAPKYAGASPTAPLVSVRVFDDQGWAKTSDIIAGLQWILDNKGRYDIRVANLSLHSANPSHFYNDPLDRAVEKLWFNGVVVVAAAGNYGVNGQPVRIAYAPGNDPFVITVGAADIGGKPGPKGDTAAPWSAYGYTFDGFSKPEIGAPGRYMVGPVPMTSTLASLKPQNVVAPGYMQLSGTSFAAPIAAAAAAQILARHPDWTPGRVKGALMATAMRIPDAAPGSLGVGELNAARAANLRYAPNANRVLDTFVTADATGSLAFDASNWTSVVRADSNWVSSNWVDSNWVSSNWTSAAWVDSNWVASNWVASNWVDSNWVDSNWVASNWVDAAYEDAAEGDASSDPAAYIADPFDIEAILADPDMAPSDAASLGVTATSTSTATTSATTTATGGLLP